MEVLAGVHKVPHGGDEGEAGKHDRGVIHAAGVDGDGDGHAEDDDGEADPDYAHNINGVAEAAERIGRVADGLAALEDIDEDGDAVRRGEADGGDAGKGVEGGVGAKVDAAEEAVYGRGQGESPERHVEAVVDAAPEFVPRDGAVAGKGVGAPGGCRQGADAGKHEDAQDEKQEAEAAGGGAGYGLE